MGINRFNRPTQYEGQLYTPPLDMVTKTFDTLQQRYDKNFMIGEEIKNNFIQSLPQDRARANELQKQYEDQVNQIVSGYGGDYSQASRDLQKMLYKIKKDYGPGGEAAAIIGNYQNFADWQKASQELVGKGKVLGEDLNDAYRYYMEEYQGIGQFDPTTGAYNQLNPETLTEYVNPDELIQNVYKNFKPEKYKIGRTEFVNNEQRYNEYEVEGITAQRLAPSFYSALNADPKLQSYLQQQSRFKRLSGDQTNQFLQGYSQQRAQDLSYMNQSDIQKAERDPLFLLRERQRLKDASDQRLMSQIQGLYELNPTTGVVTRQESKLDETDWRQSLEPPVDPKKVGMTTGIGTGFGGGFNPKAYIGTDPAVKRKLDKMTLAEAIKDPEFQANTKIDPIAMEDIFNMTINSLGASDESAQKTFKEKYGKDKNWTAQFERQVIRKYKEAEPQISRRQDVSTPILSPKAEMQLKYKLAEQLGNPSRVAVGKIGSAALQSAKEAGLDASLFIDKDGKLRKDVNVSYNYPGTASPHLGYRVSSPEGEFVFQDQDLKRYEVGQELSDAFRPIFFEGQRRGNPVRVGSRGGKDVRAIPEIRYEQDENGNVRERMYFDFGDGKPVPGSLMEVYNQFLPELEGALGAGAPKSARDLFEMFDYRTLSEEYDRD